VSVVFTAPRTIRIPSHQTSGGLPSARTYSFGLSTRSGTNHDERYLVYLWLPVAFRCTQMFTSLWMTPAGISPSCCIGVPSVGKPSVVARLHDRHTTTPNIVKSWFFGGDATTRPVNTFAPPLRSLTDEATVTKMAELAPLNQECHFNGTRCR
jgi:hypothetical protein